MNATKAYRWDIQGLRAIAVLAVVIFHINPGRLPGGYIGVDIFFVISGYLIMGSIWKDLMKRDFHLVNFYARRVRRLFPALFVMIVGTLVASYFVSLPRETTDFAKSLFATTFHVSNFFFYFQSGYFDPSLETSPLLHTWSLSVEEQFYLIFPIILMVIAAKFRSKVWAILLGIAFVSLVASEMLVHTDGALAFFSSPTRFFQFIAGGLIAIRPPKSGAASTKSDLLILIGLSALAGCLILFDASTPFPGLAALIPTLATALIIYAGETGGRLTRFLSNGLFAFFGKISYSLYLWHWPVIVFYKSATLGALSKSEQVGLLLLSIVLGYLSWRFIENLRFNKGWFSERRNAIGAFVSTSLLLVASASIFLSGLPGRFSEQQVYFSEYLDYETDRYRPGTCFASSRHKELSRDECITHQDGMTNILLVGDSHAAHLYSALDALKGSNATLTQITTSGCRPTTAYLGEPYCTEIIRWTFEELIKDKHFDKIILSGRWKTEDLERLVKTINSISQHTQEVVVFGPIIEYEQDLPRLLAKDYGPSGEGERLKRSRRYEEISRVDNSFNLRISSTQGRYVSILDAICPDKQCIVVTRSGVPVQFDYGHLTHVGAVEILTAVVENNKIFAESAGSTVSESSLVH